MATLACDDQVITVNRRWYRDTWQPTRHKLEYGHLGCGILHCHAVGVEIKIAGPTYNVLIIISLKVDKINLCFGIREMGIQYFFRKRKRTLQTIFKNSGLVKNIHNTFL